MRSRLFSMAAKPQVLAGHLSQVELEPGGVADWDTARGCSAHPTAAQSHPTELSEAVGRQKVSRVGRKEGPVKSTNADAIYLQRQKKTLPISTLLLTLPLHGKHAHRQHGCTLAPARLWELIHPQGKPKQHFHWKAPAGWWWRTGEACPAQPGCKTICSVQRAAIPFLPSAPDLKFK